MSKEEGKEKKEEFTVRIGPLLKKLLDQQKENITEATYGCVDPSEYDAGEIIAKKIEEWGGLKLPKKKAV